MRRWPELAVAVLLLAGAAAPFWAGRFLPFLDLPQHLGLAAVVARSGDPSTAFARYYEIDPSVTPYWGYYGAMWALARAVPLELANRLLFTAYALGIPLASAYLLASFGRDRSWAALAVPLVFGTNLFFGFATFLLSIPLFLVALGLAERHLADGRVRARHALPLALAAAAVFLFHAQTYLLLGASVLVLLAAHARGARATLARAVPFLPSLALLAWWAWPRFVRPERAGVEEHTALHRTYGALGELGARFEPWGDMVRKLPERIFGSFTDGSDAWIGLALAAVFAVALAVAYGRAPLPTSRRLRLRRMGSLREPAAGFADIRVGGSAPDRPELSHDRDAPFGRFRTFLLAHRCDLLVLVLLGSYFATPLEIYGQWYVSPRHLVFAALALPLLLARPATGWRRAVAGAAALVALAACANAAAKVREFQRQVGPFDAIAAELPRGGRVLGLPFDYGSGGPVRVWPLLHFACFEQVLAGGDVGFSFAGLPSIPVRYRPGMQAPHPNEWRPETFDWASMGRAYDAFLVSGAPRGRGGRELAAHAAPVARGGPFALWKPR
jgi:hypothetical protein